MSSVTGSSEVPRVELELEDYKSELLDSPLFYTDRDYYGVGDDSSEDSENDIKALIEVLLLIGVKVQAEGKECCVEFDKLSVDENYRKTAKELVNEAGIDGLFEHIE